MAGDGLRMTRTLAGSVEKLLIGLLMLLRRLCRVTHGGPRHAGILSYTHVTHKMIGFLREALWKVVHSGRCLGLVVTLNGIVTTTNKRAHLVGVSLWSSRAMLMRGGLWRLLLERWSSLFRHLHRLSTPHISTIWE